jgi:GT2 family glycosyltransferase
MGAMLAEGEYLCYSNDDVEVGPGAVETLVQVLKENDDVGEVGPKGGRWEADGSGERLGLKKIEEVDEVSGFFFVLKRKVFDEVGGFDVAYTPALFEEIDMSFRVRSLGYRCFVVPHLNIRHHPRYGISDNDEPISFLNRTISKRELQERNKKIFAEKWDQKLRKREG